MATGELQLKFFFEAITQSLNITILKGANLLSLDGSGLCNPFVKVNLSINALSPNYPLHSCNLIVRA